MKELRIEATQGGLYRVLEFLDGMLEQADCPLKTQMQIDLAVEEIYVNIASYAYPEKPGEAVIRAEIFSDPKAIEISFTDDGVPFDPLSREDPDITAPLEERDAGGLGIFLVRKTMDEVRYVREEEQNRLTIRKCL